MPTSDHDSLPDVAVGHHPDYGIVAANPKHLPASTWMLKGLDFHPLPGHPTLHVLADQDRDGIGRTTRAVALLRRAGYRVDADTAFDPGPTPSRHAEPDVAFAEHPQLGMVAATADNASALTGRVVLEGRGWGYRPDLDIYTLPTGSDRGKAISRIADLTLLMNRCGLQVVVQPLLAQDIAVHRGTAPVTAAHHERNHGSSIGEPPFSAAAQAGSPAGADLPGTAPVRAPAVPEPAAVRRSR